MDKPAEYQKYLDGLDLPGADVAYGKEHARLIAAVEAARRGLQVAEGAGVLREREAAGERLEAARRTHKLFVDDYAAAKREAVTRLHGEFSERAATLRAEMRACDDAALAAFQVAYAALDKRMELDAQRDRLQKLVSHGSRKYGLPQIHEGRGVLTCWGGPVNSSQAGERARIAFGLYARRFVAAGAPGSLDELIKGGG